MAINLDRARIIDENFSKQVSTGKLPSAHSLITPTQANLAKNALLDLFDSQLVSRHLDLYARILKARNLGFYTIGSSGHEGNAALGKVFRYTDMAFLHYRSGAFMVQRAKQVADINIINDTLLALMAAKADPIASGRHKVFGNKKLFVPPQTSTIASHLPKAIGAAISIPKAKALGVNADMPDDSVILASFGDGSVNHATAQTAFNTAQWLTYSHVPLPIVFVCEDNGLGISVQTPPHWITDTIKPRPHLHYVLADGLNLADVYQAAQQAVAIAREKLIPVFLHMKCVRLMGHAGSDVEDVYLSTTEIAQHEADDPLLHTARIILENNWLSANDIIKRYEQVRAQVVSTANDLIPQVQLRNATDIMAAIIPPPTTQESKPLPTQAQRQQCFAEHYKQISKPRNLAQMLNIALTDLLLQYDNAVVFGEDVAQKGGVYHVTADLYARFRSRRVFNAILDEQAILGAAIGLAHNGFIPIPEIQYLAYVHNAIDQIRGEAATLSFFSNGQFTNPMVIRIPGMAYQQGFGGHFHNDNSLAALRDIPGIIIALPSNGLDAVKMLRHCMQLAYHQQRVIIFIEPIALYMTKDLHKPGDQLWLQHYPELTADIKLGEIGVYYSYDEHDDNNVVAIVTYGNGYYLARQAADILKTQHQIAVKIIDLRWLAPLPQQALLAQLQNIDKILIVDEGRKTGSISESLLTMFVNHLQPLPTIKCLTGADSFITLGNSWQCLLPDKTAIVEAIKHIIA